MKSNLLKLFVFGLTLTAFTACNKDDDNGTPKTKSELLTQAAWKYQKAGFDGNGDNQIDVEAAEDCSKDDLLTFAVGGTGTLDEGATKCDVDDPQSTPITWQFKNNETELDYDGEVAKIISLDANLLKLSYDFDMGGGTIVKIVAEFKH